VGFGTEVLFILMLGMLILGPKRLHTMLGHIARAKARFEEVSHALKSDLAAELDSPEPTRKRTKTVLTGRRRFRGFPELTLERFVAQHEKSTIGFTKT